MWLDVAIDVVLARVPADGRRPLASDRVQMERLFAARRAAYGLAHLRVDVGTASADEIAEHQRPFAVANVTDVTGTMTIAEMRAACGI